MRNFNFAPVEELKHYIATDSKNNNFYDLLLNVKFNFMWAFIQEQVFWGVIVMKPGHCVGVVQYIACIPQLVKYCSIFRICFFWAWFKYNYFSNFQFFFRNEHSVTWRIRPGYLGQFHNSGGEHFEEIVPKSKIKTASNLSRVVSRNFSKFAPVACRWNFQKLVWQKFQIVYLARDQPLK